MIREVTSVEVWTEGAPTKELYVVGDLSVRTLESSTSIRSMQERAALEGLDGLFDVRCECSGACTARGFIYAPAELPTTEIAVVATQSAGPRVDRTYQPSNSE